MAYSGIGLPGIVCPDESVEQFARLYGSDHVSKMMIMASTVGNPYGNPQLSVPQPPGFKVGRTPGYVDDRNPKVNPRYGVQDFQGSRAMRHGGYGDHYNPSPRYAHPGVHHHQEGFGNPRAFQGSRATKHGGYGDHYNPSPALGHHKPEYFSRYAQQGVCPQQGRQYHVPEPQNQYIFPPPPGPRFPWL